MSGIFGLVLPALSLCAVVGTARAASPVVVDQCGMRLEGVAGALVSDLDCSASPTPTLTMRSATLDLAGFKLTARHIVCESGTCKYVSTLPGGGIGSEIGCSISGRHQRLELSDVTMTNCRMLGGKVIVRRSTFEWPGRTGPIGDAIEADPTAIIEDSTLLGGVDVERSGHGKAVLRRSTISGSSVDDLTGVRAGRVVLIDSVVSSVAAAVQAVDRARLIRVTVSDVGAAIIAEEGRCKFDDVHILRGGSLRTAGASRRIGSF